MPKGKGYGKSNVAKRTQQSMHKAGVRGKTRGMGGRAQAGSAKLRRK